MAGSGLNPKPPPDPRSVSSSLCEEWSGDENRQILIVEDNEADVFLIREAMRTVSPPVYLHVVEDGEQATSFFDQVDGDASLASPALVILDINLPKILGTEVLRHMRKSPRCGSARVIAVSTSDSERDRETMIKLGANAYFHKPSDFGDFMKLGSLVESVLPEK